ACLLGGQNEAATPEAGSLAQAGQAVPPDLVPGLVSYLREILAEAAPAAEADLRVFRREVPVRTPQDPRSVPAWAAGMAVHRTLGPFRSERGQLFWFDIFRRLHLVRVVRVGQVQAFLLISMRGSISAGDNYALAPGSVWIECRQLTASAPAGSFTGFRIKAG